MMKKKARIISLVSKHQHPKQSLLEHVFTFYNELDHLLESCNNPEKNKPENTTVEKNP